MDNAPAPRTARPDTSVMLPAMGRAVKYDDALRQ